MANMYSLLDVLAFYLQLTDASDILSLMYGSLWKEHTVLCWLYLMPCSRHFKGNYKKEVEDGGKALRD